jgi:hypothetical protein
LVSGDVRAKRGGEPVAGLGPWRLSQWSGFHPQFDARSAKQGGVRDAMPAFFALLREEEHPAVRVVLSHFIFVYIDPYMDGNGRMGRFPYEHDDVPGRLSLDGPPDRFAVARDSRA